MKHVLNQTMFPLFSRTPNLETGPIVAALAKRHKGIRFSAKSDRSGSFTIGVNKVSVVVAPMPAPIPGDDISGIDKFSALGWRPSDKPEKHKTHAIVVGTGGDAKSVAVALTMVGAELCRNDSCMGLFWGASGVLMHKKLAVETARGVSLNQPALLLWINARPYRNKRGTGLSTQGLEIFVGRNLHFLPHKTHEVSDLVERAMDFSAYLYSNGLVVKNGQSLGYTDTDIFRARWTEDATADGTVTKWIELKLEQAREP